MSMIEKAAKRYRKNPAVKPIQQKESKSTINDDIDKTQIIIPNSELPNNTYSVSDDEKPEIYSSNEIINDSLQNMAFGADNAEDKTEVILDNSITSSFQTPAKKESSEDNAEIISKDEIVSACETSSNQKNNEVIDPEIKFNSEIDDDEDITEEEVTDISGFDGFSIKSKKSTYHKNLHIDLNKLHNDGFLSPKHPDTALSSIYRMIKRPLLNNAKGKGASIVSRPNLIQVTSSFANEGKTYSAINIAISIAMEQNLNVLLIDADIRKPSLAKTFNIEVEEGLTDLLSGAVTDMKSVLYNTNIPSLTLMCAGRPHPNGTELLSGQSMDDFIEEVSSRYADRIIIFDSPPLLQTTESNTLAAHMG
ncbi:MAG: AAA family ATPase, partial [Gammaproteobacteria bacterium]|nr:AAA family ATPase [Gammaproteobacteria bacterium]